MRVAPKDVKTVGLVGAGTMGAGWAAHFLARGLDVIAVDPGSGAEDRMRRKITQAWPAMEAKGLAPSASPDRIAFRSRIDSSFADVDFVQESAPESVDGKRRIISEISQCVGENVVIASSSSYLTPSEIGVDCVVPERFIVGHPFHPVYLVPLVEVVGSAKTTTDVIDWALAFYSAWGHRPLHCRNEILGHLGNRLQRALFAEAYKLVAEGVATTEEVDRAMTDAAGLRLALFGPFMTRAMAMNDAGLRAAFEWQRSHKITFPCERDNPEMTDEVIDRLVEQMAAQVDGRALEDLEKARDVYLIELIKLRDRALASTRDVHND
ncbi:3-hydroxyacyl-CoA dehydrogenase NAD-binding domain-containing protein [Sphingomonas flavalba]|uniref:3-hydroxyacyl-CoA dehydrogenase NAD-binding domain-containing protein n=1 Tax=Sphingomonas flavalba TaxID=2559804 RepID=UPI00109D91A6|nr:3-hydroxyacyl-CoA dehydrogenase NAD-binding domain-containing protein [Sphingomonas flavalba]